MNRRVRYGMAWAAWLAAFAVLERRALKQEEDVALCHYLRPALGIRGRSKVHSRLGRVGAISFVVWFADHLWRGGKSDGQGK